MNTKKQEDWKEAVKEFKELKKENDLVILSAWYTNYAFSYYYDRKIFEKHNTLIYNLKKQNIYFVSKLDDKAFMDFNPKQRIITIQSHEKDDDPENTVSNTIAKHYNLTEQINFAGIKMKIYSK